MAILKTWETLTIATMISLGVAVPSAAWFVEHELNPTKPASRTVITPDDYAWQPAAVAEPEVRAEPAPVEMGALFVTPGPVQVLDEIVIVGQLPQPAANAPVRCDWQELETFEDGRVRVCGSNQAEPRRDQGLLLAPTPKPKQVVERDLPSPTGLIRPVDEDFEHAPEP